MTDRAVFTLLCLSITVSDAVLLVIGIQQACTRATSQLMTWEASVLAKNVDSFSLFAYCEHLTFTRVV